MLNFVLVVFNTLHNLHPIFRKEKFLDRQVLFYAETMRNMKHLNHRPIPTCSYDVPLEVFQLQ